MNKLQRLVAIALLAMPVFVACNNNDNDDNNVAVADRPTDIQRGRWQLTALNLSTQVLGQTVVLQTLDSLEACERDDLVRFTGTQMITTDEGIRCTPSESDTANYTFVNNNTVIRVTDPTDGEVIGNFNITSYNRNQMMATTSDTVLGAPFTGRYTFTRR